MSCPTVEELVKSGGRDKYLEAYELLLAVKRGELQLEAPRGARWFLSPAGLWYWAALTLVAASLLAVLYTEGPIRYTLGALLVLFLPGYALTEALYPRGDELKPLERLALSLGLSLAVVPLIGLALNYSPWGIRLEPVATALAALTAAALTYSAIKKSTYTQRCTPQTAPDTYQVDTY